jgi:hypothetical protein
MTTPNKKFESAIRSSKTFGTDYLGQQVFKKFEPVIEDNCCPSKTEDWKTQNDRSIKETIAIYSGNRPGADLIKKFKKTADEKL